VTSSRYRKARVQLGRGRAFLDEGNLGQAETALSEAIETFRELKDHGSIGAAAALLGRLYAASGRWNEAVSTYVESARAFKAAEDHLARTRVTWALEDLAQRVLPDEQRQQVDQVVAQVEERHYVTRFPDTLLRWFRRLALWGALPLTYVLTFVLGLALTVSLVIIEGEWRLWRTGAGAQTTIADALILAVFATLPVFLALWLYRLVYSLMGIAFVHLLGRRLVPIQKDQPSHLVTDATGLKYYDVSEGSGHTRTMAWSDVSLFASVDYCQRRRPIHLISSTLLASSAGTPVIVDAITAGYSYLKRDIARRLGHQEQNLDLAIFNDRWALVSVAISLAFALYSICVVSDVATYVSEVSGQEVTLPLSSVVVSFTLTLLPVFPVVTLWRLVAHRRAVQRAARYPTKASPPWLLWLAAVASTVAAVLWIAFLATIF
jgi:tetratricopeptide (TPR) repeat protein